MASMMIIIILTCVFLMLHFKSLLVYETKG